MDPFHGAGFDSSHETYYISSNTTLIWETTVRLAQIQTLIDNLCLSTCPDDAMIYCLRETDTQAMLDCIADDEDESLKQMIKDMCDGPQKIGRVKMILYHCLATLSEKLTQDILFRTEYAKFFDDLELVLSRLSDEAAATTKQEIMQHLLVAKKRHAKRNRARNMRLQRQQKSSPLPSSSLSSNSPSSADAPAPHGS
uniref:Uncharacterized protein n=1 Tax=Anopheles atroparvus TaxID=41427 RepID=A0A182J811_ANOAO